MTSMMLSLTGGLEVSFAGETHFSANMLAPLMKIFMRPALQPCLHEGHY